MDSAIRTRDLRKIYNSNPPAGAVRGDASASAGKRNKAPKPQITALDGIDLDSSVQMARGSLLPWAF